MFVSLLHKDNINREFGGMKKAGYNEKVPLSERDFFYSASDGSLNSVKPALTRMLYHAKHFFMSDTCTRSRSYSGRTSAKAAFSFSGASLGLMASLPPVCA